MLLGVYAVQREMRGIKRTRMLPMYGIDHMFSDVCHSHTVHDTGRATYPEHKVRQLSDGVHLLHAAAGMYLHNHRDANERRLHRSSCKLCGPHRRYRVVLRVRVHADAAQNPARCQGQGADPSWCHS